MRRPLLMGNWKMTLSLAAARELAGELRRRTSTRYAGPQITVCPSHAHLSTVIELLAGTAIEVGAQDCVPQAPGAVTGGTSAEQLRELGARWVILGHSERRQFFAESDAMVREKIRAAFRVGLAPVVCVGETLAQRDGGRTEEIVTTQVQGALGEFGPEQIAAITVAYEPVWAIGTGRSAEVDDAQVVHSLIRGLLTEIAGTPAAEQVRILYGGSVTEKNIRGYMSADDVDGALVGGASLDAERFLAIVDYQGAS
jgi:triosephosphate isomerase (TIM)